MVVFYGSGVEMDWLFKITHKGPTLDSARDGTLGPTIERILADLKPGVAYLFAGSDGQRSCTVVFDIKKYRRFRRSLSLGFSRSTQTFVAADMNPQNLAKAGPSIGGAARCYGK